MTSLPILTYHRLLAGEATAAADPKRISVSRDGFRRQLRWLKRLGYRSLALPDYVRLLKEGKSLPPRSFAITFDDGYEEVLTLGLPILQEFGYTATVFAVPGQFGGANLWDDGAAKLLTINQLRQLAKAGVTIGAHTCQHVHLTRVEAELAQREIADSKKLLESALGISVSLFAYPYGETDDRVDGYTRSAGFEAAFATDRASPRHSDNLFRLRRAVVFPRNTSFEILIKAQPWYSRYQDWKRG